MQSSPWIFPSGELTFSADPEQLVTANTWQDATFQNNVQAGNSGALDRRLRRLENYFMNETRGRPALQRKRKQSEVNPIALANENSVKSPHEISGILASSMGYLKKWPQEMAYLVKWKGYGNKYNSWVPEHDMNAPDLIKAFQMKQNSHQEKPKLCYSTM
ncbi:hypothetical protein R3P38DRAFT_2780846 [Favolaschia claudopus]|uniref:Chromo domain-containing protein n=1 Tax=Favolaschia claudopus TaxID=2862362 RepID=A0AAW0B848_9AGAR